MKTLSKEIISAKLDGVTNGEKISTAIPRFKPGKVEDECKPFDASICEKLIVMNFTDLNVDVDLKMKESKLNIIESLQAKEYNLDVGAIKSITQMIDDSMDDKSELSTYFQYVHKSTKSDERDQVLQVLLMLINSQE